MICICNPAADNRLRRLLRRWFHKAQRLPGPGDTSRNAKLNLQAMPVRQWHLFRAGKKKNIFRPLSGLGFDERGYITGRPHAPVRSELMGQEGWAAASRLLCLAASSGGVYHAFATCEPRENWECKHTLKPKLDQRLSLSSRLPPRGTARVTLVPKKKKKRKKRPFSSSVWKTIDRFVWARDYRERNARPVVPCISTTTAHSGKKNKVFVWLQIVRKETITTRNYSPLWAAL